jgi:HepT-like protein
MEPQERILVFLAEFDYQVEQIRGIYMTLQRKVPLLEKQPVAQESVESAGYWLHNLYSAYEDLFKLVAGFWENSLSSDGEFHVQLLKRMLLNIKDVRPALLSEAGYRILNELRGFRHVFRHAYSYGLDDERVGALLRKVLGQENTLIKDLQTFRKTVAGFAEG